MPSISKDWIEGKLLETGEIITGSTPPKKYKEYYLNGSIDFVKPSDIQNKVVTTFSEKISQKAKNVARIAPPDAVLVTCIGELGRIGLVLKEAAFNQQINCIIPDTDKIIPRFLFYRLQIEKKQLEKKASATTVTILNKSKFSTIKITYPESKKIQQEIVNVIEIQFTRLDSAVKSLKAIKRKLDLYRKSVLKAAFEGDLVKVQFEKKKIKDIALSVVYGTSEKAKQTGSVPVLRMGNLQRGEVDYSDLKFYDSINEMEDLCLEKGDLLFNRTNSAELVGKTSIFKDNTYYKYIVFASYLIRIRVDKTKVNPSYLNYWFNSPQADLVKSRLKSQQVGQANINGTKLKNIEFSYINNINIQSKIVAEIESRFSVIDKLETVIDNSLKKAETLRKSILKSAFEGKLVS